MAVLLISCEVFRPELELLAAAGHILPETQYLEVQLHNTPDKLRRQVQDLVDAFEVRTAELAEPTTILMGYGLCGRGLCQVRAQRATLVFPRIHDCISLLLGQEHTKENALSREGPIYWSSPGMLEHFQIDLHLHYDRRFALYEEKFGSKKAQRMMQVEKALYKKYECLGYITWPEMGNRYEQTARAVAADCEIPYVEYHGRADFLQELLAGGLDERRFLRLLPGQSINMDVDGCIIAETV